ncbi:MAG: alpha/beta hydrolase, partial [Acinetobacter towneri]
PSLWWLPQAKLQVPTELVIAKKGPFLKAGFPQITAKKFNIAYPVVEVGHMFHLEKPEATVQLIKDLIQAQQSKAASV